MSGGNGPWGVHSPRPRKLEFRPKRGHWNICLVCQKWCCGTTPAKACIPADVARGCNRPLLVEQLVARQCNVASIAPCSTATPLFGSQSVFPRCQRHWGSTRFLLAFRVDILHECPNSGIFRNRCHCLTRNPFFGYANRSGARFIRHRDTNREFLHGPHNI